MTDRRWRVPDPPLLLITDRRITSIDFFDVLAAAKDAGCRWFMLREKDFGAEALEEIARQCVESVGPDATLIINGNGSVAVAKSVHAAGVHLQSLDDIARLRQDPENELIIGYSAHSTDDVLAAERAGADYATLSPLFLTDSKPGYGPALGLEILAKTVSRTSMAVIGLAGISEANAESVITAGAAGIAVMGGIMRSSDPASTIDGLINAIK